MYTEPMASTAVAVNSISPSSAQVLKYRQDVWGHSYRPVPVKTGGKAPTGTGWPDAARRDPPRCAEPDAIVFPSAKNTGILTDGLRALDLDIDDAAVVAKVEAVALDLLGRAPTRFRDDSARILMLFKAAEGEPGKRSISGSAGKVEVLGRGQQFVADGLHPAGAKLQWRGGSPDKTPIREIEYVSELQIDNFFAVISPIIGVPEPVADDGRATVHTVSASSAPCPAASEPAPPSGPDGFFRSVNNAALRDIGPWASAIFPRAKRQATGAWRVSSRSLGRPLQEDLSISPEGIIDFGVGDQGDSRQGRRTPIDVVREWGNIPELIPAAHWLVAQLGRKPEDFGWRSNEAWREIEINVTDDDEIVDPETGEVLPKPVTKKDKTPVVPVPADAPAMSFRHPKLGTPDTAHPYHNVTGQLVGFVCRWAPRDGETSGTVMHITFCDLGEGKAGWRAKNIPQPRPLFGLPSILASDAPVLICGAEREAEAASLLFPDMVATTVAYDAKSPRRNDFSPVSGRDVVILAGTDPAAQTYAGMIAEEARRVGASSVKSLSIAAISGFTFVDGVKSPRSGPVPEGWQLADASADGWTAEALAELGHRLINRIQIRMAASLTRAR